MLAFGTGAKPQQFDRKREAAALSGKQPEDAHAHAQTLAP
jgi:hypothetical protein